jgi:hypothetical protein
MNPEGEKSAAFMFDRVFGPDSSQEQIFGEVKEMVESIAIKRSTPSREIIQASKKTSA